MKHTDYKTFKKEMLRGPKVKIEYNKLKPEFETLTQAKLNEQIGDIKGGNSVS